MQTPVASLSDDSAKDVSELLVCPGCDLVHRKAELSDGEAGACQRCELEFVFPPLRRFDHTIAFATTTLVLMIGSVSLPFLTMSRAGLTNQASLIEVSLSFQDGWFVLVGLLFVAFVVVFPAVRAFGLIYTLWPLSRGKKPYKYARSVYKLSESLSPWGMAEIFLIGAGVSLVKVTKLARVEFEVAFWIFVALVLSVVLMNVTLHRRDIVGLLAQGSR